MGGALTQHWRDWKESRGEGEAGGHELAGAGRVATVRPGERHRPPDSPTASRLHGDLSPALQLLCGPPPPPTNAPLFAALAPSPSVLQLLL